MPEKTTSDQLLASTARWTAGARAMESAREDRLFNLDEVTRLAAPGSWMGFDIINGEMLTSPWTRPGVEMQTQSAAPWIGTLDDPVGFLAQRGWKATLSQAGDKDADFGRWPDMAIPNTIPGVPHTWYVTAQKDVC